jgi:hypothetical protein
MRWFCFTCERERAAEFKCRVCGETECALCVDATSRLCGACAYELQSAVSLHAVIQRQAADS